MQYQMLIKKDSPTPLAQYLRSSQLHPGAHHDGSNVLYNRYLDKLERDKYANDLVYIGAQMTGQSLLTLVASLLANKNENRAIVASRAQFTGLFYTPQWRLWCARYDDEGQFEADKSELGLPPEMTQAEAREAMYQASL